MLSKLDKTSPAPMPVIFGLSETKLTKDEKAFLKDANPLGVILFARNCENAKQVKKLCKDVQSALGREAPILIDQEGGRVQRLKPPEWTQYPPARHFAELVSSNLSTGGAELREAMGNLSAELYELGINVNCAPVLDIDYPNSHESIGDRSFGSDPQLVAMMANIVCQAFLDQGVLPVIKHMPGHGRAVSDSHVTLPVVDAALSDMSKSDFLPYTQNTIKPHSEALWGMVAHVVYRQIDDQAPASCSRSVIYNIIRDRLKFSGLLLSDDICMGALNIYGNHEYRAEKVLRSGCDIALHCNGDMKQMLAVAKRAPAMTEDAVKRYNKSAAWVRRNAKV